MSNKVAIIGAGHVGATIAYTLTVTGVAAEIVLIDINEKKAFGEAMDIRQGTAYCSPTNIYSGTYADAKGADIVIITSGVARKAGQSRLELSQINTDIIKQIAPKVTKYAPDAIYVLVANPVDILTYVFTKVSGIPQNRILGSGTLLDTARLRTSLAEYYNVSQKNVHAYVFGEHGDTSFIPWSISTISSININQYHDCFFDNQVAVPPVDRQKIWEYVKNSGGTVIANKGATYYAGSIVTAQIVRCIFSSVDTALTVSSMMNGEYGISDVCLSTLAIVNNKGIKCKIPAPLTQGEMALLQKSADSLKNVIGGLKI